MAALVTVQVIDAVITALAGSANAALVAGIAAGKRAGASQVVGFSLYPFPRIANWSTGGAFLITMPTMSSMSGTVPSEPTSKCIHLPAWPENAAAPVLRDLFVFPNGNQTIEQLERDREECHRWAADHVGLDPKVAASRADYLRADGHCLEARDYSVE